MMSIIIKTAILLEVHGLTSWFIIQIFSFRIKVFSLIPSDNVDNNLKELSY